MVRVEDRSREKARLPRLWIPSLILGREKKDDTGGTRKGEGNQRIGEGGATHRKEHLPAGPVSSLGKRKWSASPLYVDLSFFFTLEGVAPHRRALLPRAAGRRCHRLRKRRGRRAGLFNGASLRVPPTNLGPRHFQGPHHERPALPVESRGKNDITLLRREQSGHQCAFSLLWHIDRARRPSLSPQRPGRRLAPSHPADT
ncbi:hypothetical protein MRX96_058574 [Rhipicephalus microplus]